METIRNSALVVLLSVCLLFSCKKENYVNATIIKDCTGTYLRVLDKDYQVCNIEETASIENEQKVLANFNLLKQCKGTAITVPSCYMYHPNEGWINVIDIKKL